jgi:hypothetical protein
MRRFSSLILRQDKRFYSHSVIFLRHTAICIKKARQAFDLSRL